MIAPRFARHELIPGWDQDSLKAAWIVVVGVGALGNEVARSLAMAGAGRLTLVDPDVVTESNLSRCVLFRTHDVGRAKVAAAGAALSELAPGIALDLRPATLTGGVGRGEMRDATLVVSALDSMAARIELAGRCASVGAGMLDAGTRPWGGEIRWYPAGGACYACPLSPAERAVLDDPWACGQLASPVEAGASVAVSALIGAWQAAFALRLLFGLPAAELTRVDVLGGAATGPGPRRAIDCPCHDDIPASAVTKLPLTTAATVAEVLARIGPDEDVMTWAGFREDASGPPVLPGRRFLRSVTPSRTLAEIGVAPGEILPVRLGRVTSAVRFIELSTTSEEPRR
ncbi:HesA/MoeB/ThiF family protein [Actinoplanes sp. CA-015351]|uniref:HesA/MoeB/ThiF family protein n=1 Tax=Actinoplanes sp. CA-015351 TaxID=3239897 RepID=UPI003D98214A